MIMKTLFKTLLATMIVVAGCQSIDLSMVHEIQNQDNAASLISSSMKVTTDLVETYLKGFKGVVATRVSDVTVDPVMNGSDTVMYLVNYPEGGWELLSADKRIPTRLMVGETGSMTLSQIEDHPGMSILLNDMRNQISAVKQSEQTEPVTEKGVFWNHISSDIPETRSDDILWNLYNTEVVYLDSTYVNHLIPTRWSQDVAYFKWYNRYVPFINNLKIDSTSGRCVTGCVPVACAQVLNYLQPILGFTTHFSFLECRCNTYIAPGDTCVKYGNLDPVVSTHKNNSEYWEYIRKERGTIEEQEKATATLMAFLGKKLGATYKYVLRDTTMTRLTPAPFTKVDSVLFAEYDINSIYAGYNVDIVRNQILEESLPVIVAAPQTVKGNGHCWIVDGYCYTETAINYHYIGFEQPIASEPIYKTVQVVGEKEEYFQMNWGWSGIGDDNVYYIDSSNWSINGSKFNMNLASMVYGFSNY